MPTPINVPQLTDPLKKVAGTTGKQQTRLDEQVVPSVQLCDIADTPYREDGLAVKMQITTPVAALNEHIGIAIAFALVEEHWSLRVDRIHLRDEVGQNGSLWLCQFDGADYLAWTHSNIGLGYITSQTWVPRGANLEYRQAPSLLESQILTNAQFNPLTGSVFALEKRGHGSFGEVDFTFEGSQPYVFNMPRTNGVSPNGLIVVAAQDEQQYSMSVYGRLFLPQATGGQVGRFAP